MGLLGGLIPGTQWRRGDSLGFTFSTAMFVYSTQSICDVTASSTKTHVSVTAESMISPPYGGNE